MARAVKSRRRYESPRRREQAESTRRAILEAAERLFERQGYGATSVAAIAEEAGVALKTVYVVFETKSGLLWALWNQRLRGEGGETPVADQEWFREVLAEPDPVRQLELNARNSRAGKERVGALFEVIRAAAPLDGEIEELWARIQTEYRSNQEEVVASIAARGALADGLELERATDILWTLNDPDLWQLLVGRREWSGDEYERWCAEAARSQLLKG